MMSMEKRRIKYEKKLQRINRKLGKKQSKRNTSNLILLTMALFFLTFIITMVVIFCVKGSVPDTLIQYTLGAGGVEAVLLAAIKISKVVVGEQPTDEREDFNENSTDGLI